MGKRKNISESGILIFSGYNNRAIISFLRTISNKEIKFAVIASSMKDEIFNTDYEEYVTSIRSKKELNKDDIKNCIDESKKKLNLNHFYIVPSTESLNRFFLDEKPLFKSLNVDMPIVNDSIYKIFSDKKAFSDLCKDNNLKIPKEYDNISKEIIPFVAKPKTYISKGGNSLIPIIIRNDADLKCFNQNPNKDQFYYQEYVGGNSYYLLYYLSNNNSVFKLSMKNILQQPEGKSILMAEVSNIHEENISKRYEALLKKMNYKGLIMIELKKFKNEYFMIEANPRFWGPSQLFVDANYNLFNAFLNDLYDVNYPIKTGELNKNAKYFWSSGFSNDNLSEVKCHVDHKDSLNILKNLDLFINNDLFNRSDIKKRKNNG